MEGTSFLTGLKAGVSAGVRRDRRSRCTAWCALSRAQLAALASVRQYGQITAADGDFVVVIRCPSWDARPHDARAHDARIHNARIHNARTHDTVITSASGIVNYFYAQGPAGARHGTEVAKVAEAAGLPRQWDFAAVADYLRLGHPLGTATITSE